MVPLHLHLLCFFLQVALGHVLSSWVPHQGAQSHLPRQQAQLPIRTCPQAWWGAGMAGKAELPPWAWSQ